MKEAWTLFTQGVYFPNDGPPCSKNCRLVHAGVNQHEWQKYINDVFRILKPRNGWAQFAEIQGHSFEDDVPEDSVLSKVSHFLIEFIECSSSKMSL